MKKIFTLILCLASLLNASAQQVNGGFDETWVECVPYVSGNKAAKAVGTQPNGWKASNIMGYYLDLGFLGGSWTGSKAVVSETTGRNGGGKAVVMTNAEVMSNNVPAYLSLGTPWNTANTSGGNADGGTFGGVSFTNRPDAIEFYYKRTASDASQPASVVAYLWSGSWSQADVPANVANNATKVTMVNRDRNIIGMQTTLGGTVTKNNGKFIASLGTDSLITETTSEWTKKTITFKYKDTNAIPEKINIIFAANDYFGQKTAIVSGNTLTVDDVTLIYNSSLSDLQYAGEKVDGFAKDKYNYYVAGSYTEGCITFTKDCVGGEATGLWDESTHTYTITVKGDDWSNTNPNEHVYTVTFVDLIINDGETVIDELENVSGGTILLNRTFKAGWNTLCLPFPCSLASLGDGVKAYILPGTGSNNDDVLIFNTAGSISKNTPYLVYFPTTVEQIVFTGRTINSYRTPGSKFYGSWYMYGTYETISMEGKWGVVNDGGKVRVGGTGSTLKGTRAYLTYTGANNVNEMRFIIDDELTHITEIDGEPTHFDVYNMQGVLVRKNATSLEGLRKGIYIVNGKKRIIK